MRSNLIPITRIYDIYPKYTYSNDVKKFMDEIMDIDRANVFTKSDMLDILDKIKAEIEENINYNKKMNYQGIVAGLLLTLDIIDKYKKASEENNAKY